MRTVVAGKFVVVCIGAITKFTNFNNHQQYILSKGKARPVENRAGLSWAFHQPRAAFLSCMNTPMPMGTIPAAKQNSRIG